MLRSLDPTYPLFPILSCLGFVCSLIPLPWHLQAWNAGTCAFMIWTASYCFVTFVNSLIWAGNVDNVAPVWCDISTQIILGAAVGIPASTLCISRRLYTITAVRTATVTREDKRRAVIGDLCIAVGIPILVLIMHIAVQPHRFDIFEDVGCYPVTYNTLATYFLYLMWPVLIGVVSFTYSFRTLKSFWIRRAQFSELVSSNSAMNPSRYFRLMLLAVIDMMFTVPLGVYTIYNGTHGLPLNPWISWEDTHFDFGRVGLFPTMMWRSNINAELGVELTRWISVFSAVVFFSLFGFAAEARKHYRMAFLWVAKWFGYTPTVKKPVSKSLPSWVVSPKSEASSDPPPMYSPGPKRSKDTRDSLASSFGDMDLHSHEKDVEKFAGLPSPASVLPLYGPHEDLEGQHHASSSTSDHPSFRASHSWVSFSEITDHSSYHHNFDETSNCSTSRPVSTSSSYNDENTPRAI